MKPSRFLLAVTTLMVAFSLAFAAITAQAASKPAKPPPPVDGRKLVQSVDAKASTIVIQYMRDKSTHTYKIDEMTVLKVNNISGKVADIVAGMEVTDYAERDYDTLDSLTLQGYGPTPDPAAKKKKQK